MHAHTYQYHTAHTLTTTHAHILTITTWSTHAQLHARAYTYNYTHIRAYLQLQTRALTTTTSRTLSQLHMRKSSQLHLRVHTHNNTYALTTTTSRTLSQLHTYTYSHFNGQAYITRYAPHNADGAVSHQRQIQTHDRLEGTSLNRPQNTTHKISIREALSFMPRQVKGNTEEHQQQIGNGQVLYQADVALGCVPVSVGLP